MKILTIALGVVLSASLAVAQNNASSPANSDAPSAASKIDPAKEADIRHLLEVAGTAALVQQLMTSMEQSLRPTLINSLPPGEYREKLADLFFQKFRSKFDTKRLLDLSVARYDENFSDEEIKGITQFYQTPLGQKVITLLPKLTLQSTQDGQKLGQQAGRDAMVEVLSEYPDLARQLQEASRGTAPASR